MDDKEHKESLYAHKKIVPGDSIRAQQREICNFFSSTNKNSI